MFRVIDTIRWSEQMQERLASSGVPQLGNGVLAILDPAQVKSPPIAAGGSVRVHCPDGTVTERRVAAVEVRHSVVGLFFADTHEHEIPRLSQIELVSAA
jgi:hypothetical protein